MIRKILALLCFSAVVYMMSYAFIADYAGSPKVQETPTVPTVGKYQMVRPQFRVADTSERGYKLLSYNDYVELNKINKASAISEIAKLAKEKGYDGCMAAVGASADGKTLAGALRGFYTAVDPGKCANLVTIIFFAAGLLILIIAKAVKGSKKA